MPVRLQVIIADAVLNVKRDYCQQASYGINRQSFDNKITRIQPYIFQVITSRQNIEGRNKMIVAPLQYTFVVNQQKLNIRCNDRLALVNSFQLIIRLPADVVKYSTKLLLYVQCFIFGRNRLVSPKSRNNSSRDKQQA